LGGDGVCDGIPRGEEGLPIAGLQRTLRRAVDCPGGKNCDSEGDSQKSTSPRARYADTGEIDKAILFLQYLY